MLFLGVRWPKPKTENDNSDVVACVRFAKFDQITKAGHRWNEAAARKDHLLSIRHIEFGQHRCFIEFIVHYTQKRNATAALNSPIPDNNLWHEHFFEVYRVIRLENGFIEEICDSLIDCLLGSIRRDKQHEALVKNALLYIIGVAHMVDVNWGGTTLADSLRLIKLSAALTVYHAKGLLEWHELDQRKMNFCTHLKNV